MGWGCGARFKTFGDIISGEEIRIRELAQMIKEMVGYEGEVEWDTTRLDGQPQRKLEASKAKEQFGFQAEISLKEGLHKTIEWYKESMLK